MKTSLLVMGLLILSGCAGIDHRTTGSPVINIEWAIAPLLDVEEEAAIPEDPKKKRFYLAQAMAKNGGFWFVNSWAAGSLLPSISIVTEYFCDPGTWPNQAQCRKTQSFAASDSGWLKQLGTATIIGGAYVGGQAVRRPNRTNINQSASGNAQGGSAIQSQGQYQKLINTIPKKDRSPGWGGVK